MIAIFNYLCDSPRRTASPLPPGSGAWWWSPCGPWSPCCYHCNQSNSDTQAQLVETETRQRKDVCLLSTLWLHVPFIVIDTKLLPNEGKKIPLSDIELNPGHHCLCELPEEDWAVQSLLQHLLAVAAVGVPVMSPLNRPAWNQGIYITRSNLSTCSIKQYQCFLVLVEIFFLWVFAQSVVTWFYFSDLQWSL